MKTIITTLTSIALLSISCSKQEETAETATSTIAYPLDVCIVSDEKLGSMGEPVVITHEGREIKFCCDACQPRFEENPEKYLGKLEQ